MLLGYAIPMDVITPPSKICSKCAIVKPLTEFHIERRALDSRASACKKCNNATHAVWAAENAEAIKARATAFRRRNAERINADKKAHYIVHKEQILARNRAWRQANPEIVAAQKADYARRNPQVSRESGLRYRLRNLEHERTRSREKERRKSIPNRLKRYGLTHQEFRALIGRQRGCCPGCLRDLLTLPEKKGFHVDHCHTTGKVRGLLCGQCNISLGQAKDNPAVLRRLAGYLDFHAGAVSALPVLDYLSGL